MNLTVTSRSSTQNLITLAAVRSRLLDGDESKDDLLSDLIAGASAAMARYYGQPFGRQTYQLAFRGDGCSTTLLLPRYPIDPDSVSATINGDAFDDVVVLDASIGKVFRYYGWCRPTDEVTDPLNVVLAWKAGAVLPDQVQTWAPTLTGLEVGTWIRPTSPSLTPLLFEVTTAGDCGGDEPDWPTDTGGGEVELGGDAKATARVAEELDPMLTALAYVEVFSRYSRGDRPPGLASQLAEGFQETYFATQTDDDLCAPVRAALDRMRAMVA